MNSRILHPDIVFPHSVDIQTRFSDYDTFGHVNNNAYMAFLDIGKSEFFRHIMGRPCTPTDLAAVIVNINVDFLSPALQGEPLRCLTAVVAVGERSFAIYQRIINPTTGDVKVQATSTLAGFDLASQSSAPLVQTLRDALSKLNA